MAEENIQSKAPQIEPAQTPAGPTGEPVPEKSDELLNVEQNPKEVTGRCMKCKKTTKIKDPKPSTMKNGREMMKGSCPDCGTTVCKIVASKNPKIAKKVEKKAKEVIAKGKKLKKQIVKQTKAVGKSLKLYVVTFWKGETQHVWAVKAATTDGAEALVKTAHKGATDLKNTATYTLDDWIEAMWRQWPLRRRIAKKLSKESRQKAWNALNKKAKAIVRRNYLVSRINKWAANPPMDEFDDVEDEIAGPDDVDDGYDPKDDAVQNPPQNLGEYSMPAVPLSPNVGGFDATQNPVSNPASETDFTALLNSIRQADDRMQKITREGSNTDRERLKQLIAYNTRDWPRPNPPEVPETPEVPEVPETEETVEEESERIRVPDGYYIKKTDEDPGPVACKKCGGDIMDTQKLAHNPKGGMPFYILQCAKCGAKYKLSNNSKG